MHSMDHDVRERLLAMREVQGDCWVWTGSPDRWGYGQMRHGGRKVGVHRLAYEVFVGPIPPGMVVMHLCDNPPCFKPEHLRVGTQRDNVIDMIDKGRGRSRGQSSHCRRGHPYEGNNIYWKPDGNSQCRICKNEYSRAYYLRSVEARQRR